MGRFGSFYRYFYGDLYPLFGSFQRFPEARSNPEYNLWGSIYGAFLRPCVPLFVMLTGMLLLPVEQEIGQFYKNKDASCGNTVCRLVFVV